jgi:hypothetical protein
MKMVQLALMFFLETTVPECVISVLPEIARTVVALGVFPQFPAVVSLPV